jgi:LysM repeat protein
MRKMQASTLGVAAAIVAVHAVVLGVLALVQGCGTTRGPVALPDETPMPPALVPLTPLRPDPVTPLPAPVAPAPVVAPVRPVTPPAPGETSVYVVGKGDHLSGIAKQLGVSVKAIMELNDLRDANKIYSGQRLTVPGKVDQGALPVRPVGPPPPAPSAGAGTYVVRAGDSLSVIAQRYGVSTADLAAANGLKSDLIRVGQKLTIPAGGKEPVNIEPRREPAGRGARDELPQPVLPVTAPETTGAGIGRLPTDLAPVGDAPVGGARKHKVQAGDTLLSVASQWNVSIADLKRANDVPDGPLTPGQVLTIPVSD